MSNTDPNNLDNKRSNILTVNPSQKGNPLLKFIHNIPWEFHAACHADYEAGPSTGIFFLSVRYHRMHSAYIYQRLKAKGPAYRLRVLLLLLDAPGDSGDVMLELTKASIIYSFVIMPAHANDEAAKIIESYKLQQHKSVDDLKGNQTGLSSAYTKATNSNSNNNNNTDVQSIKESQQQQQEDEGQKQPATLDIASTCVQFLSGIKGISAQDAQNLLEHFGTLAAVIRASESELSNCPGITANKSHNLWLAFNQS